MDRKVLWATMTLKLSDGSLETIRTTDIAIVNPSSEVIDGKVILKLEVIRANPEQHGELLVRSKRQSRSQMYYGHRDGCISDRHDTARAYDYHRCRCPKAEAAAVKRRREWYERNAERLNLKRRQRRAEAGQSPTGKTGNQSYRDPRPRSDIVIVNDLVSGIRRKDASRPDRWHAITILYRSGKYNKRQIADRVGYTWITVHRYIQWLKENPLKEETS